MSETTHAEPSRGEFWTSFLGVILCFAIFALLLAIAYWPRPPEPLPDGVRTPAERAALLAETRGAEVKAAGAYAVIDPAKGVYRLPVERAMELVVEEQRKAQGGR